LDNTSIRGKKGSPVITSATESAYGSWQHDVDSPFSLFSRSHPSTACPTCGWLSGRAGNPEAELAVDVQLASRAVSGRLESADERPKVRVEALRVRRRGLCGDFFRILVGSRPRKQTVQIAPGVFGELLVHCYVGG
jgi:hypothetical protein